MGISVFCGLIIGRLMNPICCFADKKKHR